MRWIIGMALLWSGMTQAQIPEAGEFHYLVFDSGDQKVGRYDFSITKYGNLWQIASEMNIDTRVYLMKVRLRDQNSFTHDGIRFLTFSINYFKDVPFQRNVHIIREGRRDGGSWHISGINGPSMIRESFDEVRNLVSRLIRPEAVLRPGESRITRSLDPLTLEIGPVESRGIREESVDFQGSLRKLYVIEQKAPDGDVVVKKFNNGLIFRSETSHGYALLQTTTLTDF